MIRESVAKKISSQTVNEALTRAFEQVIGRVSGEVRRFIGNNAQKRRKGGSSSRPAASPVARPSECDAVSGTSIEQRRRTATHEAETKSQQQNPRSDSNKLEVPSNKGAPRSTSLRSDGGGSLKVHIPEEYLADHILRGLKLRLDKASVSVDKLEEEMLKSGMTADKISAAMKRVDEAVRQEERWRDAVEQRVGILQKREKTQEIFSTPSHKNDERGKFTPGSGESVSSKKKSARRRGSDGAELELSPVVRVPGALKEKAESDKHLVNNMKNIPSNSPIKKKKSMAPLRQREVEERVYRQVLLSQMHIERRAARFAAPSVMPVGVAGARSGSTRPW